MRYDDPQNILAPAKTEMPGTTPGHFKKMVQKRLASYAVAMSGNTASILVFKVAALNGLTM
jgi:hypothetical protein